MKKKSPLILGGIFVVLVIVFLATSINPPEKTKGAEPLFPGEKPDIDKIEVYNPKKGMIVVERKDGIWNITKPIAYKASENAVKSTINTLLNTLVDGVVSSREESQAKFDVGDSVGTSLKAYSGEKLVVDAIIGKQSIDLNHTYTRLAGKNDIYIWRGMMKSHVDREPNDWRDKSIYSFNADDIMTLKSVSGKMTKELALTDSTWTYKENGAVKPIEQKNAKDLISLIAGMQCDAFADEKDIPRVVDKQPDTRVTFTVRNGDVHSFDVWTPGDQDAGRYLVRKENGDEVFRFYRYRGSMLVIDYEKLKVQEGGQ